MPHRCDVCLEDIITGAFDYVVVYQTDGKYKWYHPCCAVAVLDNKVAEICCEKHWLASK